MIHGIKILCIGFLGLVAQISPAQNLPGIQNGITVLGKDTILSPEIMHGDTVEAVFYIANKGSQPFWIYQVYASCQCTAPHYAKDTFYPGRQDSVVLVFYSKKETEHDFEKFAVVLTPLGEKSLYLKGQIHYPAEGIKPENKRIRLRNQ